jgi:transposase
VRAYLDFLNQGLDESGWKITCIRFAPNDPKQNPIEDIWLQAKRLIQSTITCANLLIALSSYLSLPLIAKPLSFLSYLPMAASHK